MNVMTGVFWNLTPNVLMDFYQHFRRRLRFQRKDYFCPEKVM